MGSVRNSRRRRQSSGRTVVSVLSSIAIVAVGGACWFAAGIIALSVRNLDEVFPRWGTYLVVPAALAFLVLLGAGRALINGGRRALAASATETMARDGRPPVLYLRGFSDDAAGRATEESGGMPFAPLTTAEEQVRKAFQFIGPLIAVGRPGEPIPELGASRFYLDHSEWQQFVSRAIDRSALVVIRLARSPGVLWEFDEVFRRKPPERVVLLVPFGAAEYEAYRNGAPPSISAKLPPWQPGGSNKLPVNAIVTFDQTGQGTLVHVQPQARYSNRFEKLTPALRMALKPLADKLGIEWVRPPFRMTYWLRTLGYLLLFSVLILLLARACGSEPDRHSRHQVGLEFSGPNSRHLAGIPRVLRAIPSMHWRELSSH